MRTDKISEMCRLAESDTSVFATRNFWRLGVQVSEAAITYAIYIMILVGAVAGAAYIYGAITGSKVRADTITLVRAVQEMFAADAKYEGVSVDLMVKSGRLPDAFIAGDSTAWEIWVGGQQGAFPVALYPGASPEGDTVAATSNRFFTLVVGNEATPIREPDTCSDLVSMEAPGLRGVQVQKALPGATLINAKKPPEKAGEVPPAVGDPAKIDVAWSVVTNTTTGMMNERGAGRVATACQTVKGSENKMIVFGFN